MRWIEIPNATMVRIQVYLVHWNKVNKREITSQILREEVHLEHVEYQDVDYLMDLDSKWCSALGKS